MPSVQQHSLTEPAIVKASPWHSPVPYLFGGLAAMVGLIVFALLILAWSYWKLSRRLRTDGEGGRDLEAGDIKLPDNNKTTPVVLEEKYLVIMAGELKPTFLATPSSSRTSSFGSNCCRSCSTTETSAEELSTTEKEKDESSDHQVEVSSMGSHVSADQVS